MGERRGRLAVVNRGLIRLPAGHPFRSPLPGSEVAAVNLAEALAARGVEVTYFGAHEVGARLDGVPVRGPDGWRDLDDGDDLRVVWLRDYHLAAADLARLPRARHVLWTEDTAREMRKAFRDEPAAELARRMRDYAEPFAAVVFASRWHLRDWADAFGAATGSWHAVLNSARHVPWRETPPDADHRQVVHTSHPRKALAAVAAVARLLRPHGFRVTCSSDPVLYQQDDCRIITPTPGGGYRSLGTFAEFAAAHRTVLAFVPAFAVAAAAGFLDRFRILLHPDYTEETGASAVIEALRRGLVPVVSDLGALPEIVGDAGVVVPGRPWTDEFAGSCRAAVLRLDDAAYARFAAARTGQAARFGDDALIDGWTRVLWPGDGREPDAGRTP